MAERPRPTARVGGGTAEGSRRVHQTSPAQSEIAIGKAPMRMEEVLRRENMLRAHQRVKSNGGSPGVDVMTVDELGPWLVTHWESIREELLSGSYRPQAVRLVEIPKPGGRGKRRLGIPTVLDRLIQQAVLQVLQQSIRRFKEKMRPLLRRGRGRSLRGTISDITPLMRGWVQYFREVEARTSFEELDKWIRRKLRCILWRQWKCPRTRVRELKRRGLDPDRAARSAMNGRGPWWNAGASHMHTAVPTRDLTRLGLLSLLHEHRRLQCLT